MKPILVIVSVICGILMLGGLVGYTYEDEMTGIPVPPVNQVGFAEEPLTESAIPSALIDAELTLEWNEDVWVGLITQDEFERCAPSNHSLTTSLEMSITPLMGALDLVQEPRLMYNTVSRLLLLGPSLFFSDCSGQAV